MRDRLMKLLCGVECDGEETFGNCPQRRDGQCGTVQKLEMCQIGAIADHLLANGVIVPPCKVGDTVFIIDEGDEGSEPYVLDVVITAYGYDVSGFWATINLPLGLKMSAHFGERMFGKTVFLTSEEAERAMKGEHHAEIH